MTEAWQYQIRIGLAEDLAEAARRGTGEPALAPLMEILARHNATLKCQYDAFAEYVAEAERQGLEDRTLYRWTKATLEDPAKTAKHLTSFTLYLEGEEVYDQARAEALEAELRPLLEGGLITRLSKHDTDPAKNPQAPARYRA